MELSCLYPNFAMLGRLDGDCTAEELSSLPSFFTNCDGDCRDGIGWGAGCKGGIVAPIIAGICLGAGFDNCFWAHGFCTLVIAEFLGWVS